MWNPDQHTEALAATATTPTAPVKHVTLPMDLQSRNTVTNVDKNEKRIDYCVTTFSYVSNRMKCITNLTGGPFLA